MKYSSQQPKTLWPVSLHVHLDLNNVLCLKSQF